MLQYISFLLKSPSKRALCGKGKHIVSTAAPWSHQRARNLHCNKQREGCDGHTGRLDTLLLAHGCVVVLTPLYLGSFSCVRCNIYNIWRFWSSVAPGFSSPEAPGRSVRWRSVYRHYGVCVATLRGRRVQHRQDLRPYSGPFSDFLPPQLDVLTVSPGVPPSPEVWYWVCVQVNFFLNSYMTSKIFPSFSTNFFLLFFYQARRVSSYHQNKRFRRSPRLSRRIRGLCPRIHHGV